MARNFLSRGLLTPADIQALVGQDPSIVHHRLLDALNAPFASQAATLASILGDREVSRRLYLHAPCLSDVTGDHGSDVEVRLEVIDSPIVAFPALSETDTRALMHAWDELADTSPFLASVEHAPDVLAGWEIEMLRDALADLTWDGDTPIPDPAAVEQYVENTGMTTEDAFAIVADFARQDRRFKAICQQAIPTDDSLTPSTLAVVQTLRRLTAFIKALPGLQNTFEDSYVTCLMLAPPDGIYSEAIDNGLQGLSQDSSEGIAHFENLDQLLDQLPLINIHLTAAHAALEVLIPSHEHSPVPFD